MKIKYCFLNYGETVEDAIELAPEITKLIPLRLCDIAAYILQAEDRYNSLSPSQELLHQHTVIRLFNAATNEVIGTYKVTRMLAWDYTVETV